MRLTERSSLSAVAAAVADVLRGAGIRAILSGGGCAAIYTRGIYRSVDLDFILQTGATQADLEHAMTQAGFHREGNQYFHDRARFYVEFPPGPLSIGADYRVVPVELKLGASTLLALSATDSCRDRLAAFLHWRDQQNLKTAVWIALQQDVDLTRIREWCQEEGNPAGFDEFHRMLESERRNRQSALRRRRDRKSTNR